MRILASEIQRVMAAPPPVEAPPPTHIELRDAEGRARLVCRLGSADAAALRKGWVLHRALEFPEAKESFVACEIWAVGVWPEPRALALPDVALPAAVSAGHIVQAFGLVPGSGGP